MVGAADPAGPDHAGDRAVRGLPAGDRGRPAGGASPVGMAGRRRHRRRRPPGGGGGGAAGGAAALVRRAPGAGGHAGGDHAGGVLRRPVRRRAPAVPGRCPDLGDRRRGAGRRDPLVAGARGWCTRSTSRRPTGVGVWATSWCGPHSGCRPRADCPRCTATGGGPSWVSSGGSRLPEAVAARLAPMTQRLPPMDRPVLSGVPRRGKCVPATPLSRRRGPARGRRRSAAPRCPRPPSGCAGCSAPG